MSIFVLNPKAQIILVNADIIGHEGTHTIRMIFDTGASFTMIHPDVLVRIGCEPTTLKKQKITTASGIEFVSFITIPEIRVLGERATNLEISVHDLPSNLPAEGLLGLNFLRNFNLHLNFLDNQLEVISR